MGTETLQLFDWQRIFFGDLPAVFLLELLFRTTWMYLWALLISRMLGKRAMGVMTSLDALLVVAIGSATGDPMMGLEIPILHGMVVLLGIMLLERGLALLTVRSGKVERLLESTPTPLVRDGEVVEHRLREERMTPGELMSLLRLEGIRDVGEVERAWLEPTGNLSVFLRPQTEREERRSTWPPRRIEEDRL